MTTAQQKYWLQCGIRWEHIDATFDNYETDSVGALDAREAMLTFCRPGGDVFAILSGEYGTGKSHLAAAALKSFGAGVFTTNVELLSLARQLPLSGGEDCITRADLVDTIKTCPVLIIDELGASAGGVDENALLDDVLSFRADRRKATVFTTNMQPDRVAQFLGGRLMDRINQSLIGIPPVRGSRRAAAVIKRDANIPTYRFCGVLPAIDGPKVGGDWRKWLTGHNVDHRQYVEYRFVPQHLRERFEKEQQSES